MSENASTATRALVENFVNRFDGLMIDGQSMSIDHPSVTFYEITN